MTEVCWKLLNTGKKNRFVWATQFTKLLQLSKQEKKLQKFNLKQHLTCKNYGMYVAECKFCKMQYVGQKK